MKKGLAIAAVVLIVAAAVAYWATRAPAPAPNPPPPPEQPTAAARNGGVDEKPGAPPPAQAKAEQPGAQHEQAPQKPATGGFCDRDFDNVDARAADVAKLQADGGLVHIFEREAQLQDPYGCAAFYLDHGLDVNAVDPRADHDHLTGLHFAIKRNDPRMLHFMIDHGADLKKRAGENNVKPMGYAYYLALNDTRIDRNEVIGILDAALTQQASGDDAAGKRKP